MFSTRLHRRSGGGTVLSRLAAAGGGALLLLPALARAACGLEGCPAEIPSPGDRHLHIEHEVREFAYSLYDIDGRYTRYQTRVEAVLNGWAFGIFAPVVHLRDPAESATGLSGVVLFGERSTEVAPDAVSALGMQLELPGSGSDRITGDHAEVLAYASLRAERAGAVWFLMGGVRAALSDADEESDAGLHSAGAFTLKQTKNAHGGEGGTPVVNPHERREMTARAGVNLGNLPGGVRPSFYVHGDRVFQGNREGDTFGSAGVMVRLPLGERGSIRPVAEVPFGGLRRFDWNAGIGVRISL